MLHIYKASAGSGKTFALTRQYLTLLLGEKNPETGKWRLRSAREGAHRHILAITFTNKATQEMTRRIISQLAILARREPGKPDAVSPYLEYFINLFHTDRPTLSEHASDMLDELLADFAFFHVSTIDAFFQNVLRIFAREVEMPDNFRLEIDNSTTISLGVDEMFKSLNAGNIADPVRRKERDWLTDWLTRMMVRKFESGGATNLFSRSSSIYSDLVKTFNLLLDETFQINLRQISGYLEKVEYLAAFEKGLDDNLRRAQARLRDKAAALMQYGDYAEVNRYIRSCAEQWAAGDMREPTNTVIEAIDNPAKRFNAAYYKKGAAGELDFAVAGLCADAEQYCRLKERTAVLIEAITPLGLLGCLLRHISSFCKDNNVILLSDTNTLLRDIINDDETPFVYERLGYYLRHFLIDEVQDTSRLQWDNLRPLLMESLSHEHENLVIGDEKQCIYRFRNSDPNLLGHIISDDVTETYGERSVSVEGNTIDQNNNWRSAEAVVKFNNSIFHALTGITGVADSYSNVIQQINSCRSGNGGYVKLIFEPLRPTAGNDTDASGIAPEGNASSFALDCTVAEVDRMLSAGYRPGQIAILVRKHKEGEAVISRLLHCHENAEWRHGPLEVKSTDAVGVGASPTVKMIIEILRLTQLPHTVTNYRQLPDGTTEIYRDENPAYRRARLLYCYRYFLHTTVETPDGSIRNLTNSEALAKAIETMKLDSAGTDNASGSSQTPPGIASLKEILEFASSATSGTGEETVTCLTLTAIVDKIIARYVIPDALPRETAYITAFQDLVYDFCSQGNSDIRTFLSWWDHGGSRSSLSSTSESDAVNVVTIHQSKGLEYPCVIIPFCNGNMVQYSSAMLLNYQWMGLDRNAFNGIAPEVVPPLVPVKFEPKIPKTDIFARESKRIIDEQYVDNLNISYVAFTRAVNELVVIAPLSKDDRRRAAEAPASKKGKKENDTEAPSNLSQLLRKAVESLTPEAIAADPTLDPESKKWVLPLADHFDGNILEIGTPTIPTRKKEEGKGVPVVTLPPYSPYVNEKLVTLTAADIEIFDYDNPRHRGNLLHRILSGVRHRADLNRSLRRAARRYHLTPGQTAQCAETLTRAVNAPEVERWFEGYTKLYREQSIVTSGTDRRPDRIVILEDGTVEVIDYKFGADHPSYTRQVRRYMSLLREAGYTRVKGYLWFVPSMTIRTITP